MVSCESEEMTDTGYECYIATLAAKYTFTIKWQRALRAASQAVAVFEGLEVLPLEIILCCQVGSSCRCIVDMIVVARRLRVPRAMLLESSTTSP